MNTLIVKYYCSEIIDNNTYRLQRLPGKDQWFCDQSMIRLEDRDFRLTHQQSNQDLESSITQ